MRSLLAPSIALLREGTMTTASQPLPMSNAVVASEDLLHRVRGEYLEMPGLRLTPTQAARLWGLNQPSAHALLERLAETGFLARTADGQYSRPRGP